MAKVRFENGRLWLDDFEIKGEFHVQIRQAPEVPAEIVIIVQVNEGSKIEIDSAGVCIHLGLDPSRELVETRSEVKDGKEIRTYKSKALFDEAPTPKEYLN